MDVRYNNFNKIRTNVAKAVLMGVNIEISWGYRAIGTKWTRSNGLGILFPWFAMTSFVALVRAYNTRKGGKERRKSHGSHTRVILAPIARSCTIGDRRTSPWTSRWGKAAKIQISQRNTHNFKHKFAGKTRHKAWDSDSRTDVRSIYSLDFFSFFFFFSPQQFYRTINKALRDF